jgi:hypothetical protein
VRPLVACFVSLLKSKKSPRYLLFLSSLCSCQTNSIPENQDLISGMLFHGFPMMTFGHFSAETAHEDTKEPIPERARVTHYVRTIEMLSRFVALAGTGESSPSPSPSESSSYLSASKKSFRRRDSIEMSYAEVVSHTDEREHDMVDAAYQQLMGSISAENEAILLPCDTGFEPPLHSPNVPPITHTTFAPSSVHGSQRSGERKEHHLRSVSSEQQLDQALLRNLMIWPNILLPVVYDAKRDALFVPMKWSPRGENVTRNAASKTEETDWIELSHWWGTTGAAQGERDYFTVSLQVFTVLCRARRKEPGSLVSLLIHNPIISFALIFHSRSAVLFLLITLCVP